MLYARVLIGNAIEMNQDKKTEKLLMPPVIDPQNPINRFDSVKGRTKNSDIYMIYTNK